jgi:Ras-related protein Rab-21
MEKSYDFKVVTLGEGRVGKTSLTLKFVRDTFADNQESTLKANFLTKDLNLDGVPVRLNIWDTAGQEKFRSIASNYYRQAKGALIVYDITDKSSFARVVEWVKELNQQGEPDICIAIVGNKCDRESERQITKQEATEYARRIGALHLNTSAKTGKNVEEVFQELSKQMVAKEKALERKADFNKAVTTRKSKNIIIKNTPEPQKKEKKDKCC